MFQCVFYTYSILFTNDNKCSNVYSILIPYYLQMITNVPMCILYLFHIIYK